MAINEQDVEGILRYHLSGEGDPYMDDAIQEVLGEDADQYFEPEVNTFLDEGVLTMNRGLVLRFPDGSEFQLTIVQSN